MSDTPKRPYAQVKRIADKLLDRLAPGCARIELAGSLRRQRPLIGDIEIVAIPKFERPVMGPQMGWSEVDKLLSKFVADGGIYIKKGDKLRGHERKYVQFSLTSTGDLYSVDLFLQPDPATWGVNFMIRTGSSEFSRRMVTPKSQGGYMPNGYVVKDARVWSVGAMPEEDTLLPTPEEADVFALWAMDFVDPKERN